MEFKFEFKFVLCFSSLLSHDSRLRCDMVDLYYSLYGSKRPMCLPQAELAAMFKPQKVAASSSASTSSSAAANADDKKIPLINDELEKKPLIIESTIYLSPPQQQSADKHTSLDFVDKIELSPNDMKRDSIELFDSSSVKIEPDELELIEVNVSVSISFIRN